MNPTTQRPPASKVAAHPEIAKVQRTTEAILDQVRQVIVGKHQVLKYVAAGMVTEGCHILFEDMPGLAKSVMASAVSQAAGCDFRRIQFTPDLLPGDITGTSMYSQATGEFSFRQGPIFCNFLLADEINRASPKTQSALLEAMAEKQVSVEGQTMRLPVPFMVLATQNPVEQEGTYPLPEAQLDRFMLKLSMGYPSKAEEKEILQRRAKRGKDSFEVRPVASPDVLHAMAKAVEHVLVSDAVYDYVTEIIDRTRTHKELHAGSSPRGSLALFKLSRSWAAINGRAYVTADDVRELAIPVLAHRIIVKAEARLAGRTGTDVMKDILAQTPIPKFTVPA
ncbi:MAG TPA: MoxR family ATPase [Candidatus Thermoplasmatota archaeon]|nr:MoxR family ATPase [Candidatus Thermoplasmatota archaeon]